MHWYVPTMYSESGGEADRDPRMICIRSRGQGMRWVSWHASLSSRIYCTDELVHLNRNVQNVATETGIVLENLILQRMCIVSSEIYT